MARVRSFIAAFALSTPPLFCGCGGAERTMLITSEPSGALVYMNDQEVGRTPLRQEFTWYGEYDVTVRKEGYETIKTSTWVWAPWWQWPPVDFAVEFLPFRLKDEHAIRYELRPASPEPADPSAMLSRAEELRQELRSSRYAPSRADDSNPVTASPD